MRRDVVSLLLGGSLLLAGGGVAFGHSQLTYPLRRADCTGANSTQCKPPAQGGTAVPGGCGGTPNPSVTPTTFVIGSSYTLTFDETVNHVARYRLALSTNGETAFDNFVIMAYGVTADQGGTVNSYNWQWTVPDTANCDPCVMQLIQGMDDDMNGSFDTTYYNCADVRILPAGAPTPTPGPTSTPTPSPNNDDPIEVDGYGSCSVATAGGAGGAGFALLVLLGAAFRKRRA